MLSFIDWSWVTKSILAVPALVLMTVVMMLVQKKYGFGGEKFFFAWYIGIVIAFIFFANIEKDMSVAGLFSPLGVFFFVVLFGALVGAIVNVFIGQAIHEAPNPALVWAIIGINTPLSYIIVYKLADWFPDDFSTIEFNAYKFAGIILTVVGTALVMKPSN